MNISDLPEKEFTELATEAGDRSGERMNAMEFGEAVDLVVDVLGAEKEASRKLLLLTHQKAMKQHTLEVLEGVKAATWSDGKNASVTFREVIEEAINKEREGLE